jgi:rare lipoprotein A (peptidoglycan hydrolase)
MQNKNKQVNILIITFLVAIVVIITTKAYERPFMPGGPFYEPEKAKIEATNEDGTKKDTMVVKEVETTPQGQETDKKAVVGVASWYDYGIGGMEWSKSHRTCASRTLERYTMARVTNIETGASVECYVNDWIEHPERDIDLSSYAFRQIADLEQGLVKVKIEQL